MVITMTMKCEAYAIRLTFTCGEDIKKYLENKSLLKTIPILFPGLDNNIRMIDIVLVKTERLDEFPTLLDI